jgi:hypothetical protein
VDLGSLSTMLACTPAVRGKRYRNVIIYNLDSTTLDIDLLKNVQGGECNLHCALHQILQWCGSAHTADRGEETSFVN